MTYASYCLPCVGQTKVVMLTGYSLKGCHCDRCYRRSDLAVVKVLR